MIPTILKEFVVALENRPGSLSEFANTLARAGININGLQLQAEGDFGLFRFVTTDPAKTEAWLKSGRYPYRVREGVAAPIEDERGAVGRIAEKLAKAGVNIDAAYHVFLPRKTGYDVRLLFVVDDAPRALKALD